MNLMSELVISSQSSVRDSLVKLDQNAKGIVFVLNDKTQLVGVLTDGDIRRALLMGHTLESCVTAIMNTNYFSLPFDASKGLIEKSLHGGIRIIPLINESGNVVDYVSQFKNIKISVASPLLGGNELEYVTDCIKSSWISSQGSYVREFERIFTDFCKQPHALAVSNGTVALHLALVALGITSGDEVIVPDFTFAATINSVIYTGATPVIADVEEDTWNLCPKSLESVITSRTKAIIPVHIYGHPCKMDEIMHIARKYNLLVIEDVAEALGSEYKGLPLGSFGDAATFSFFGNKTITTGEGGMVLFKNEEIAKKGQILRDHGKSPGTYWHDMVGFNYRLTNIQAAIGVAQMEQATYFIQRKIDIAKAYNEAFSTLVGVGLPPSMEWAKNSYWLYTVKLPSQSIRDTMINKLKQNDIESRPAFYPLHRMPPYKQFRCAETLANSIEIAERGISFPSSVALSNEEQKHVIQTFIMLYQDILNKDNI